MAARRCHVNIVLKKLFIWLLFQRKRPVSPTTRFRSRMYVGSPYWFLVTYMVHWMMSSNMGFCPRSRMQKEKG